MSFLKFKIPLFDIDWTLLKGSEVNNKVHFDAYDYVFQKIYHLEKDARKGFSMQGKIDPQIIIEIAMLNGISKKEAMKKVNQAMSEMVSYFKKHADEGRYEIMPGVVEILNELKSLNIPTGLLTGNIAEIGWEKVKKSGISKYFSFGAFGSMTNTYKRVDLIEIASKEASEVLGENIHIKDFVIIGDSPLDIACAREGGIPVIAVGAGYFKSHQLSHADLTIESLKEKDKITNFLKN